MFVQIPIVAKILQNILLYQLPNIIGEYWFYLQGENSCTTKEGEVNLVVDVNYDSFFVTMFH